MASSIVQPGGRFNCSNFVQLVEVNEGNDLYMEDGAGGHHSEALDSDNEPEPLNFNNQNDFPFDPDDIDASREVQAMAHAMLSLTQGMSKPQNKEQKQEEKRKQREADWTQTEVEDFSADISPFLGAPSGPRGPAALLKSTDSPFKYCTSNYSLMKKP